MYIVKPSSFSGDLLSLYNSYLVVKKQEEKDEYSIVNQPFSHCRDAFLMTVHNLFAAGAESLVIVLPLPPDWQRAFEKVHKNWAPIEYLNFHFSANKKWFVFRGASLGFSIEKVDYWGTNIESLVFTISRNNYLDPALFWLLTQELRVILSGYSKIDAGALEYRTEYYQVLIENLKSGYIIKKTNLSTYKQVDTLLAHHSPYNIISWHCDFMLQITNYLATKKHKESSVKEYLYNRNYAYNNIKQHINHFKATHTNLILDRIYTPMGLINTEVLEKLVDLIEDQSV